MPKKKQVETQSEQSARFVKEAEELIAAGKLSPTDGERALDAVVRKAASK